MSVTELVRSAFRHRLNCDNCHRNRFYVYRQPSGRLILVCYSCQTPQEVEQQSS